jgi:hypothetical protein
MKAILACTLCAVLGMSKIDSNAWNPNSFETGTQQSNTDNTTVEYLAEDTGSPTKPTTGG